MNETKTTGNENCLHQPIYCDPMECFYLRRAASELVDVKKDFVSALHTIGLQARAMEEMWHFMCASCYYQTLGKCCWPAKIRPRPGDCTCSLDSCPRLKEFADEKD